MEIGAFALSSASKRTALVSSTLFLSLSLSRCLSTELFYCNPRERASLSKRSEKKKRVQSLSLSFLFFSFLQLESIEEQSETGVKARKTLARGIRLSILFFSGGEKRRGAPSLLTLFCTMESNDEEPPSRACIGFLLLRLVLEREMLRKEAVAAADADTHAAASRRRQPPPPSTEQPLPAPLDTPHLFLTLDGRRTVLETDDG